MFYAFLCIFYALYMFFMICENHFEEMQPCIKRNFGLIFF